MNGPTLDTAQESRSGLALRAPKARLGGRILVGRSGAIWTMLRGLRVSWGRFEP
jgi:hypothetical protein